MARSSLTVLLLAACGTAPAQSVKLPPAVGGPIPVQGAGETGTEERAIALTRSGQFAAALPLLEALVEQAPSSYALRFNLALCLVGTGEFRKGADQLLALRAQGQETPALEDLLAQAYIGMHDLPNAWTAVQKTMQLAPHDERLYAFLLDACSDHYEHAFGLRIATMGLQHLPASQRLHYERAVDLARLDRLPEATSEFARASLLGPTTNLGYLSRVQEALYANDTQAALKLSQEAVQEGHKGYEMLSLLGTVWMVAGVSPGQPQFLQAKQALEGAVAQQPNYPTAQIALGRLYEMEGDPHNAIKHLEIGRRLEPQNRAIYPSLSAAYRQVGNTAAAAECTKTLAGLLQERSSIIARDETIQ